MPDEKKDPALDADILQSKADIREALRAAGKSVPDESSDNEIILPPDSTQQSEDDLDILDLDLDEPPINNNDTSIEGMDLDIPEADNSEASEGRIISFEESHQTPNAEVVNSMDGVFEQRYVGLVVTPAFTPNRVIVLSQVAMLTG